MAARAAAHLVVGTSGGIKHRRLRQGRGRQAPDPTGAKPGSILSSLSQSELRRIRAKTERERQSRILQYASENWQGSDSDYHSKDENGDPKREEEHIENDE